MINIDAPCDESIESFSRADIARIPSYLSRKMMAAQLCHNGTANAEVLEVSRQEPSLYGQYLKD